MSPVEKSFTGGGGTRIVYDDYEPDGPRRGLVMIAHGLGEHAARYRHVADRITAIGLRVVAPDHRGHGRSEGKRVHLRNLSEYADDFEALRRLVATPGQPTFVLGHSMGGTIALDYALDHPDDLAGLILSGAAVMPGSDQGPALLAVAKVLGRIAPSAPTVQLAASSVSKDPAVVAAYESDPLVWHGKVPAGLGGAMLRTMATFPDRAPSLRIPLLVMHGADDKLTNPEGSRMVHARAGSADKTLTVYPDLYHEIFNEPEQDVVLTQLTDWLQAHLAPS